MKVVSIQIHYLYALIYNQQEEMLLLNSRLKEQHKMRVTNPDILKPVFLVPVYILLIDTVIEPFRKWTAVALGQNLKRDWIAEKLAIFQSKLIMMEDLLPFTFPERDMIFNVTFEDPKWERLFKSCEIIVGI